MKDAWEKVEKRTKFIVYIIFTIVVIITTIFNVFATNKRVDITDKKVSSLLSLVVKQQNIQCAMAIDLKWKKTDKACKKELR